jgi:hypothetical protein
MRDFLHSVLARTAIPSNRVVDNTPQVSAIIDMQGFESAVFVFNIGTIADTDTTIAPLLEESDVNFSGQNTVADTDMTSMTLGVAPLTAAAFRFDSDSQVRTLGYIGGKRYLRLTLTPSNNTGNMDLGVVCLLSRAGLRPTVQGTS